MLVDLDQIIKDPAGRDTTLDGKEPAKISLVLSGVMFTPVESDRDLSGIEKARIGNLGFRIYEGGKQEFSPEDVVVLRQRVGETLSPLHVARLYEVLGGIENK